MTTKISMSARSYFSTFVSVCFVLLIAALFNAPSRADDARTITLLRPLSGATVREKVPIRVAPADLPTDGYFTVSIDKVFRTAEVITPGTSLLYVWDTQASYQDPNEPGVDKYTADGDHEIEVAVYDRQGTLLANGTAAVNVSNAVSNLPDGVKLSYAWSENTTFRYKRHSELSIISDSSATPPQSLETSDIRFSRSVEDSTGGEYLIRDQVYPDGLIVRGGTSSPVQDLYNLKSRYRTVNSYGDTLVEETPFSQGSHFGFAIPQVPTRRITAGDSWDTKIEISVPWASEKTTVLDGSARLDGYEWQDGYPTAKVIETYDGPAQLYADPSSTTSFQADNVHLVRTYWFAYNSKRLVKSRTLITIDANVTQSVISSLTSGAAASTPGLLAPSIENPFGTGAGDGNTETPGMNNGQSTDNTSPIKLQVNDEVTLVGV